MTGLRLEHDWFPLPLPPGVEIGPRSWVYSSFAFIHCKSRRPRCVRIGADSGVYHTTFFELGPEGEVEIGDFCSIVGAIIATNGRVAIQDHVFVAHEVVIADGPFAAPPGAAAGGQGPRATIEIGINAWI